MKKTKRNLGKRLGTGIGITMLAGITTFAPAVGVLAAPGDVIDTTKEASLTIHKYDQTAAEAKGVDLSIFSANGKQDTAAESELQNYVIQGVEFSYIKVGDIRVKSDNGDMGVLYDIPEGLASILEIKSSRTDGYFTSDVLNTALASLLANNTAGKNALEDYIAGSNKTAMALTDEAGVTKATNMAQGLYLVVETKVPANVHTTTDPFFVSLPMTDTEGDDWFYDVTVYPKNQTNIPTLNKKVRQHDDVALEKPEYMDSATISEGEVADYIFVSKLPKITSKSTYLTDYTFIDKLSKGLEYNKDVQIMFYDNESDANSNNTVKAIAAWNSEDFNTKYETIATGSQMTVTPTAKGLAGIDPSMSEAYMVVSYSATAHSDEMMVLGDDGNPNEVQLKWKRTSQTFIDTLEDEAEVFSFGIDLTKEFAAKQNGSKGDATQVKFVLKNKTDGHYIMAREAAPGKYHVTDGQKSETEENATVFSPSSNGKLNVYGLEADTYELTEVHTDAGYTLLKAPVEITIETTVDTITPSTTTLYDKEEVRGEVVKTQTRPASAKVDNKDTAMISLKDSKNALVEMSVLNTPGFTLPPTGGLGTIVCTMAGAAAAFAGVAVVTKKRKKEE